MKQDLENRHLSSASGKNSCEVLVFPNSRNDTSQGSERTLWYSSLSSKTHHSRFLRPFLDPSRSFQFAKVKGHFKKTFFFFSRNTVILWHVSGKSGDNRERFDGEKSGWGLSWLQEGEDPHPASGTSQESRMAERNTPRPKQWGQGRAGPRGPVVVPAPPTLVCVLPLLHGLTREAAQKAALQVTVNRRWLWRPFYPSWDWFCSWTCAEALRQS